MILPLPTLPPPPPPPPPLLPFNSTITLHFPKPTNHKPPFVTFSILTQSKPTFNRTPPLRCTHSDIDMVPTQDGIFAPKQPKVVILWDLDNKPPRGPPYEAALALRSVAERFGQVVDISAYANRHAFTHLPNWVVDQRRERRRLDVLEKHGIVTPSEGAYICKVCGRKCRTNMDLKKHFRQLHERERVKKLNRMKQLKGKKRQRFKERYLDKNYKYEEAARSLITPKVGYGLAKELRRAGVFVKIVEDKPQAADWALKRQMVHSMSRGIDWLFLVSDDGDFRDMLRRAREADLGTVVVGDQNRVLGRNADLWVSWIGVENGEVSEKDLVAKRKSVVDWEEDEDLGRVDGLYYSSSEFDGSFEGGFDLDTYVDHLVSSGLHSNGAPTRRISAFSDEEENAWLGDDNDDDGYESFDDDDDGNDFLSDSEDEFEGDQ